MYEYQLRNKSFGVVERASVGRHFCEIAGRAQAVFYESAVCECAVDKSAVRESAALEDAVSKLTADKIANVEEDPVPINSGKRATYDIGVDNLSLDRTVTEFAIFEIALVPLQFGDIAFAKGLGSDFHDFLLARPGSSIMFLQLLDWNELQLAMRLSLAINGQ